MDFTEAKKMAEIFATRPALHDALAQLNDAEYRNESGDYRTRLNHGFTPHIEHGYFLTVEREFNPVGHVVYNMTDLPPLSLEKIIPLLSKQYDSAHLCYNLYVDLIREQHAFWPKAVDAS